MFAHYFCVIILIQCIYIYFNSIVTNEETENTFFHEKKYHINNFKNKWKK